MKHMIWIAAGALALAGCGQAQKPAAESNTQAAPAAQTYSGTGKVTAIAGNQVTIQHGPIEGIGWPAMTMTFTAPDGMASSVKAGDEVSFSFRQEAGVYPLTSLQKR
jgi:Cu/Ag efflux protein CusF